jgi:phage shock protein C
MEGTTTMKKLYLSNDKKVFGVCGGVGEYFDIDPTLIRLGMIVITVLTGMLPGIIGYVVAGIIIPPKT